MNERAPKVWALARAHPLALAILMAIPFVVMPPSARASIVSPQPSPASHRVVTTAQRAGTSTPPHIMLIVDENKDYQQANLPAGNNRYIINNPEAPYLNQLAGQYASATQEYSLFHPSFKNYLALLSGAVISSGTVPPTDTTLVKQLSDAGIPWTAYMDGLNFPGAPSPCDSNVT